MAPPLLALVPLIAYAALLAIASWRLIVHRPARCSAHTTSAKFAFHVFLTLFAVGRTAATALDLTPLARALPSLILNSLSNCSYVSLLLFLEMHWRDILQPLAAARRRTLVRSWALFFVVNTLLYIVVGLLVWFEWSAAGGKVSSMWWSGDVVDALLVAIAVSYTYTAIRMYLRITASLALASQRTQQAARVQQMQLLFAPEDGVGEGEGRPPSVGASPQLLAQRSPRAWGMASSPQRATVAAALAPLLLDGSSSSTHQEGERMLTPSRPLKAVVNNSVGVGGGGAGYASEESAPLLVGGGVGGMAAQRRTGWLDAAAAAASSSSAAGVGLADPGVSLTSGLAAVMASESSNGASTSSLAHTARKGKRAAAAGSAGGGAVAQQGDRSQQQLRDALAVFIAIMLSSALLLCIRAALSAGFSGNVTSLWWWQLFVVWFPDVPPCGAYLLLMWPRDDDKALAARSHSRMGQLFTRLLESDDTSFTPLLLPHMYGGGRGEEDGGERTAREAMKQSLVEWAARLTGGASSAGSVRGEGGLGYVAPLLRVKAYGEEGEGGLGHRDNEARRRSSAAAAAVAMAVSSAREDAGSAGSVDITPSVSVTEFAIAGAIDALSSIGAACRVPMVECRTLPPGAFASPLRASVITLSCSSVVLPQRRALVLRRNARLGAGYSGGAGAGAAGRPPRPGGDAGGGIGNAIWGGGAGGAGGGSASGSSSGLDTYRALQHQSRRGSKGGRGGRGDEWFGLPPSYEEEGGGVLEKSPDIEGGGADASSFPELSLPTPMLLGRHQQRHTVRARTLRLTAVDPVAGSAPTGEVGRNLNRIKLGARGGSAAVPAGIRAGSGGGAQRGTPPHSLKASSPFLGGTSVGSGTLVSSTSSPDYSGGVGSALNTPIFSPLPPPHMRRSSWDGTLGDATTTAAAAAAAAAAAVVSVSLLGPAARNAVDGKARAQPHMRSLLPFAPPPTLASSVASTEMPPPLPNPVVASRLLGTLRKWLDWEVYLVVSVGLRAVRRSSSSTSLPPPPPLTVWRYVGHTEPVYLDEEAEEGGQGQGNGEGEGVTPGMLVVESQPVLRCAASFGISVVIPHRLLSDAHAAAQALGTRAKALSTAAGSKGGHAVAAMRADASDASAAAAASGGSDEPGVHQLAGWSFEACARFQLRWYDEMDEDRQMRLGGPHHTAASAGRASQLGGSEGGMQAGGQAKSRLWGGGGHAHPTSSHTSTRGSDATNLDTLLSAIDDAVGIDVRATGADFSVLGDEATSHTTSSSSFLPQARELALLAAGFSGDVDVSISPSDRVPGVRSVSFSAPSAFTPTTMLSSSDAAAAEAAAEEEYCLSSWQVPAEALLSPRALSPTQFTVDEYEGGHTAAAAAAAALPYVRTLEPTSGWGSLVTPLPLAQMYAAGLPLLPPATLLVRVERIVDIAPGFDLLAQPGTTSLKAATALAAVARAARHAADDDDDVAVGAVAAAEDDDDENDNGDAEEEEEEGGDAAGGSGSAERSNTPASASNKGPWSYLSSSGGGNAAVDTATLRAAEGILDARVSSTFTLLTPEQVSSTLRGEGESPHAAASAELPPTPRRFDATCYAYDLNVLLHPCGPPSASSSSTTTAPIDVSPLRPRSSSLIQRAMDAAAAITSSFDGSSAQATSASLIDGRVRPAVIHITVAECTMESAYSIAIPRAVLPLILARRLGQLEHARASLQVYVRAMAQGGQRGAWKDSQLASEENTAVRRLRSGGAAAGAADAHHHVRHTSSSSRTKHVQVLVAPPSEQQHYGGGGSASNANSSGFGLSTLYGRLVSHIEREEEAKAGALWLVQRVLRLHAYCSDLASCLVTVCGSRPDIARGGAQLAEDVAATLLEASSTFRGPSRSIGLLSPLPATALAPSYSGSDHMRAPRGWGVNVKGAEALPPSRMRKSSSVGIRLFGIAAKGGGASRQSTTLLDVAHLVSGEDDTYAIGGGGIGSGSGDGGTVSTFKPSTRKKDRYSRWVATNLHAQVLSLSASLEKSTAAPSPSSITIPFAHTQETLITVGAPAAHWNNFAKGAGLGSGISRLVDLLNEAMSVADSRRELAVNAMWRDVEDTRLSLRLRSDSVTCQAITAVSAAFGAALQNALDVACTGATAEAVLACTLQHMSLSTVEAVGSSGVAVPRPSAAVLASAAAASSWSQLLHASSNEGVRQLRQWTVPPPLVDGGAQGDGTTHTLNPPSSGVGFLVVWESLLSCAGKERGMLDDARVGAALASNMRFVLVDAGDASLPQRFIASHASSAAAASAGGGDPAVSPTLVSEGVGEERGIEPLFSDATLASSSSPIAAALCTLRPRVLGQHVRALPAYAFRAVEASLLSATSACVDGGVGIASAVDAAAVHAEAQHASDDAHTLQPGVVLIIPVAGLRAAVQVGLLPQRLLPLSPPLITHASSSSTSSVFSQCFSTVPVCVTFLSLGINEAAAAAELLGSASLKLQRSVNAAALAALHGYARGVLSHSTRDATFLHAWATRVRASILRARALSAAAEAESPQVGGGGGGRAASEAVEHHLLNIEGEDGGCIGRDPRVVVSSDVGSDSHILAAPGRLWQEFIHSIDGSTTHAVIGGGSGGGGGVTRSPSLASGIGARVRAQAHKVSSTHSSSPLRSVASSIAVSVAELTVQEARVADWMVLPAARRVTALPAQTTFSPSAVGDVGGQLPRPATVPTAAAAAAAASLLLRTLADAIAPPTGKSVASPVVSPSSAADVAAGVTEEASAAPPSAAAAAAAAWLASAPEEAAWLARALASTCAPFERTRVNLPSRHCHALVALAKEWERSTRPSRAGPSCVILPPMSIEPPWVSASASAAAAHSVHHGRRAPPNRDVDRAHAALTVCTSLRSMLLHVEQGEAAARRSRALASALQQQNPVDVASTAAAARLMSPSSSSSLPQGSSFSHAATSPMRPLALERAPSSPSSSIAAAVEYNPHTASSPDRAMATAAVSTPVSTGESPQAVLLRTFEDAARLLRGARLTSCKSAKDRTGMSVTLEEARLCAYFEAAVVSAVAAAAAAGAPPITPPAPNVDAAGGALHAAAAASCTASTLHPLWASALGRMRDTWGPASPPAHHPPGPATALCESAAGDAASALLPSAAAALATLFAREGEEECGEEMDGDGSLLPHARRGIGAFTLELVSPDEAVAGDALGMAQFLREYGPRLANAEKNTGVFAFAFNTFQRAFFPLEYRAPTTTIGGSVS